MTPTGRRQGSSMSSQSRQAANAGHWVVQICSAWARAARESTRLVVARSNSSVCPRHAAPGSAGRRVSADFASRRRIDRFDPFG